MFTFNLFTANIPAYLREHAEDRIGRSLAGFQGWFDSIRISLLGLQKGPEAVTCQLKLRLTPSGIWLIQESNGHNPHVAIERAVDAAASSLRRHSARFKPALAKAA